MSDYKTNKKVRRLYSPSLFQAMMQIDAINFNEYLTTVNYVSCHVTYNLFLLLLRNVMRNH